MDTRESIKKGILVVERLAIIEMKVSSVVPQCIPIWISFDAFKIDYIIDLLLIIMYIEVE